MVGLLPFSALAQSLAGVDRSPMVAIHGLPMAAAEYLSTQDGLLGINWNLTNSYDLQIHDSEVFTTDYESSELLLSYQHGWVSGWNWRLQWPFYRYSGGFMDHGIEAFHDAFGFPQNGRDLVQQNQLLIHYQRDGVDQLHFAQPKSGMGDVRLAGGYYFGDATQHSVWGELKLPTGDPDHLTGSGAASVSLWWQMASLPHGYWRQFAVLGGSLLQRGDVLSSWQRQHAWYASWGTEWSGVAEQALIYAQLDVHSGLYDSELSLLGGKTVQFSLGARTPWSSDRAWHAMLIEDIKIGSAPDVTFQLGLQQRY